MRSAEFLNGAHPDSIGLPQGSVYRPSLGDAHFGALDKRRTFDGSASP